jgi:hypothetical protein
MKNEVSKEELQKVQYIFLTGLASLHADESVHITSSNSIYQSNTSSNKYSTH